MFLGFGATHEEKIRRLKQEQYGLRKTRALEGRKVLREGELHQLRQRSQELRKDISSIRGRGRGTKKPLLSPRAKAGFKTAGQISKTIFEGMMVAGQAAERYYGPPGKKRRR